MPAFPQLDGRPEVVVDVDVSDGLFSILLRNIGPRPALDVKTTFDTPFTGLGGRKAITTMRVFKGVDFMAPGKVFEQFVDPLSAYAARREPLLIKATVVYRDRAGHAYEETMTHDLRVYMELGQARVAD
jgi:hypothetical protein